MADDTVKAWQRIVKPLAGSLPGEWSIGGSGAGTLLVKQPVEWVVTWIGISRVRRDDEPRMIGGLTPLVIEFGDVAAFHGLSTPVRPGAPQTVDMTANDAADAAREFSEAVLNTVAPWTQERLAAEAEDQLAQAPDTRSRPLTFPYAPGWRVVLGTGDPTGPAREAADWFERKSAPKRAPWFRNLADAWETGGPNAALKFLEANKAAALQSLKLR